METKNPTVRQRIGLMGSALAEVDLHEMKVAPCRYTCALQYESTDETEGTGNHRETQTRDDRSLTRTRGCGELYWRSEIRHAQVA